MVWNEFNLHVRAPLGVFDMWIGRKLRLAHRVN